MRLAGRGAVWEYVAVALLLAALSASAILWVSSQGYTLYYGDAESHLNTARRIVDSRTPGYDQLGSPWLPIPHLLMLPFIGDDAMWKSGLAGAIPSGVCFVIAGLLFYGAARMAFDSGLAGATAVALFALNPNMLYIQSIPMNEAAMFAGLCGMLFCTVWFARGLSLWAVVGAAFFSLVATLSRYESWPLLALVTIYFLVAGKSRRWQAAFVYAALAALGPLYWFFHNWYCCGDPLEFYRGPYSALAINERAVKAGMPRYGGDHDWAKAWLYYATAARLCAGIPLAVAGVVGLAAAAIKRVWWPLILLFAPCASIVMSMYGSNSPIFVPGLWPLGSYYNTRYGLAGMLLCAFAAAAIVSLCPLKTRAAAALAITLIGIAPWLLYPRPEAWICWKESEVNSEARRNWTEQAVAFFRTHRKPGEGIYTSFGDLTGIVRTAGIPIRETLYDGNNPAWMGAEVRPGLFLHEEWALALAGDTVATTIERAARKGPHYDLVKSIVVKGAPVVQIYKRN